MINQPPRKYDLDQLCSIEVTDTMLQVDVRAGTYDVNAVSKIVNKLDALTGGREYLTVINCDKTAKITFRSLKVLSKAKAMQYALAKAYVIHSSHQRIMASIYMLVFRPKKPIRFFSDVNLAKIWLHELVSY